MSSWSYNWLSWVVHEKMLSKMLVFNWLMFLLYFLPLSSATASPDYVKAGCDGRCGTGSVPYPFGIRKQDCALNEYFFLNCSSNSTAEELFYGENIPVRDISVRDGTIIVSSDAGYDCYDKSGMETEDSGWEWTINLGSGPFTFSDSRNKFITIGCDTLAWLRDIEDTIGTACFSLCSQRVNLSEECLGSGCCQTSIPNGLRSLQYYLSSQNNYTNVSDFNRCGYAFLADERSFNFSDWRLSVTPEAKNTDFVVEWVVENKTCEQAKANTSAYACGNSTYCVNNDQGYRCKCKDGFEGNPYLPFGCEDIDECADPQRNHCTGKGKCKNTPGNYTCTCPIGMHVDGRTCQGFGITTIASVIGAAFGALLFLAVGTFWLYKLIKEKRSVQLKRKAFKRNGGLLLKKHLSSSDGRISQTKLFTSKELAKATDEFNVTRILGQGGEGTVYKGMLPDGEIVAIKRSKMVDEGRVEGFINEVVLLSQINHRNIVRLLGCCLETEVPLLVYEFVPNGTLFQYIHDQTDEFSLSWEMRLQIAAEIAGALSYLHSAAAVPIYHRDIKSTNILLDEKYKAKVSDFGTSRSIAIDQTHLTTDVKGTFGYLDPEYFRSSQFTDKSDVYSFGVVLVELLTGLKPILKGLEEYQSLADHFILSMEKNSFFDILDDQVKKHSPQEEVVVVANLAMKCLNLSGKGRPIMKEIAMELEGFQSSRNKM